MSLASNVTPILNGRSRWCTPGTSDPVPSPGTPAGPPLLAPEGVPVIGALRLPLHQSGGASLKTGDTP